MTPERQINNKCVSYRGANFATAEADHAANGRNSRIVDLRMQHDVPHEAQAVQHRNASAHFSDLGRVGDAGF